MGIVILFIAVGCAILFIILYDRLKKWFKARKRTQKHRKNIITKKPTSNLQINSNKQINISVNSESFSIPNYSDEICRAFKMNSPAEAYEHFSSDNCIKVKDYENECSEKNLFGGLCIRSLYWCKECKAFFFVQKAKVADIEECCYFHIDGIGEVEKWNSNYCAEELLKYYFDKYLVKRETPEWKNFNRSIEGPNEWKRTRIIKQEMLEGYLVKDPIYSNTSWKNEYDDGDSYDYLGYQYIDWYCPLNKVTVDEAIKCIDKFRDFCDKRKVLSEACDCELSKLIYIRIDSEQELSDEQIELCENNKISIIVDKGEHIYFNLIEQQLYKDKIIWGYGSVDDAATTYERKQEKITPSYVLSNYRKYEGILFTSGVSNKKLYHDKALKKWRLSIQLDKEQYWFLSVFFNESSEISNYSLDYEDSNDSHYEFKEEENIRKILYKTGDEHRFLDEIFRRNIEESSGFNLLEKIRPFITEQFHF